MLNAPFPVERQAAGDVPKSSPSEPASWTEAGRGHSDQDLSRLFYRWGGHLSSALIRIRAQFDGDLDQYLLYLVFLLADLSQSMGPTPQAGRRGLNALSLSDITHIPRETTRRKLLALVDRGYLVRDDDGLFLLGDRYGVDEFFADLRPLFRETTRTDPRP